MPFLIVIRSASPSAKSASPISRSTTKPKAPVLDQGSQGWRETLSLKAITSSPRHGFARCRAFYSNLVQFVSFLDSPRVSLEELEDGSTLYHRVADLNISSLVLLF